MSRLIARLDRAVRGDLDARTMRRWEAFRRACEGR
jgi:hypothetical protein